MGDHTVTSQSRKDIIGQLGRFTPGSKTPDPVPTATPAEPRYDHAWLPETIQDNVAPPAPKLGAIDRRIDVLYAMEVGQSFALPGHLVSLWRDTASKMRKRFPSMKDSRFTVRSIDELNSRMWRVK